MRFEKKSGKAFFVVYWQNRKCDASGRMCGSGDGGRRADAKCHTAIGNSNVGSEINFATRLPILFFTFQSLHHIFNRTTSDLPSLFYRKNSIELAPIFNRLNGNAKSSVLHHNFPRWSAKLNGLRERGSGRRRESFAKPKLNFLAFIQIRIPKYESDSLWVYKRWWRGQHRRWWHTESTIYTRLPKIT